MTRTTETTRSGWLVFAAVMLMVAGLLNLINGITALHNSSYYTSQVLYHNLSAWGWIFLIWGALQLVAGFSAFSGRALGSYLGVTLAAVAATMWFFFLFGAPFAAIVGVTVNILVIYGLTVGAAETGVFD
jgi:hypothetical protein